MKLFLSLLLSSIATTMFIFSGCSRIKTKVGLPVEEITRPLSLPPRSVRLGAEGLSLVNSDDHDKKYRFHEPTIMYPYFSLGEQWEYYIPAFFRFHILKNTEVRQRALCATGGNCAVSAGLRGVNYYGSVGWMLLVSAAVNYKRPIDEKVWFAADLLLDFQTESNLYGGTVQAGIGYQIAKHVYATLIPSFSVYNPSVNDDLLFSFPEDHQYVTFPLLLGVNFTRNFSVYWQSSVVYYRENTVRYGQGAGFHFTW